MQSEFRILLCGDTGISVEFGSSIDPAINARVRRLLSVLKSRNQPGILDLNPTYRSLFIQYDPWICSFERLLQTVEECVESSAVAGERTGALVEIPVCYGNEFGPDIEEVAAFHDLVPQDVARLHAAPVYQVYMIGFTPGFPYLGGLDERLQTPRKSEPRKKVAAGSVGIADRQTGIYPIESPGGWRIIGRTPLSLFDPGRKMPFLLQAGDFVRFVPISGEDFAKHSDH